MNLRVKNACIYGNVTFRDTNYIVMVKQLNLKQDSKAKTASVVTEFTLEAFHVSVMV